MAAALAAAVFLVYQPAWQGGLIWDDDMHVTRPELRSWHGLYRIWFEARATLQYYPLVHSAFWIEHTLWGDDTLGYHLVNIALHVTAAILVAAILRRLAIPGAYLAAAIFALHPVQVETVAWISELKNTLSAVFYLAAAMLYLRFDEKRGMLYYGAALGFFLLALATKTVTGTLPGALLVIFWWQRGRLSWRKDVLPLLPFFVLGAGGGMITAWWELEHNKCFGPEFEFTRVERILIAGRSACFHLGKLFWPANLTFIYPRWQIDPRAAWQYLFPLSAAALLAAAWSVRRRSRAPLAALLYFGGTLFPVLGFFNLYTYRYSLIADHYQYLACLGIITLFSATLAALPEALCKYRSLNFITSGTIKKIVAVGSAALLLLLACLSWRQSLMYADVETLWKTTIDRNPACWLAHNNLGLALAERGQFPEAISHYQNALELKPDYDVAHNNLGLALAARGEFAKAISEYETALAINPGYELAHNNLGLALAALGDYQAAITHYEIALKIKPSFAVAHNSLGAALAAGRQFEKAQDEFQTAVDLSPNFAEAHTNLARVLAVRGDLDAAIVHYQQALHIKPDYAPAHYHLADALGGRGRLDEAIGHSRKALEIALRQGNAALAKAAQDRLRQLGASN